jgi:hypothetical protein
MTGTEITVPAMTPEEWAEVCAKQAIRIADLTQNLRDRDRSIAELRAEQDSALWREGVIR